MTTHTINIDTSRMRSAIRSLNEFSDEAARNIRLSAIEDACRPLAARLKAAVPYNNRKRRKQTTHYRDSIKYVVRSYANGSVVGVIGHESRKAPHAHLIEKGTKRRFTNSRPTYKRMAIGARQTIKRGRLVIVSDRQKVSLGSRIKNKRKPQLNRGRMPATHVVENTMLAATSDTTRIIANSLRAGIQAEFSMIMNRGAP